VKCQSNLEIAGFLRKLCKQCVNYKMGGRGCCYYKKLFLVTCIVETPNTQRLADRLYVKRFIIKRETAQTIV